ncbi:Na+/H+ antiporter NhaC [Ammoniphilus sp. 3BR4]|uniref:Na+/H+ antiporter NhaC n=1 Tax=Ammoniphilus sp. 3BR4 TaxID=3158265 RepID=UPI003466900D
MIIKTPSFGSACAIFSFVIAVLGIGILHYEVAPQMPIVLSIIIVALYGLWLGIKWKELESSMIQGIVSGLPSILILCLIGMLIGVWILNGTVPTLSYYGLQILSPTYFLASSVIICAVTSVVTGSSWSTIGTIGVALMATAYGMGIPLAMAAGAIVSGAFFGDKMSPLSDTTNLAPAVANVSIFDHIRHMLWTTVPSLVITLGIFVVLGLQLERQTESFSQMTDLLTVLKNHFPITLWTLFSPLLILVLATRRVSPIPTLVLGLIAAVLTTYATVPDINLGKIMTTAHFGYTSETGMADVDKLLSRGGLANMMFAVSLIIVALAFGGIIQKTGIMDAILNGMKQYLTRKGNVILATVISCFGVNVLVGEQYLSIVLPGKIIGPAYKKVNLHPVNLSRTLEDAGTLLHALIPWGVSGAFIMSTLNIGMEYAVFAFLCFINPIIAIIYGYTGWCLKRLEEDQSRIPPHPRKRKALDHDHENISQAI